MIDYKPMYFNLAGKLANTIEALDALSKDLKEAQREGEMRFIEEDGSE